MKDLNPDNLPEDAAVVICELTSAPHVDEVRVQKCDFCGEEVWYAKTTEDMVNSKPHGDVYKMCMLCAIKHNVLERERMGMPSDEQLMDVAKRVGVPFEEVKARITEIIKAQNISVSAQYN